MPNANQGSGPDKLQVGDKIEWDGLDPLIPYLQLVAPPVVYPPIAPPPTNNPPNLSKYPNVVGTGRLAVTDQPVNIRKRSWMGWFLWGDGTPPPGISPGYPIQEASPPIYGDDSWDYYSWQYPAGKDIESGNWKAIRLDQQPLYLNPFRLNYNWPPGKFGYEALPLKDFAPNVGYWSGKQIVRGVNLSFAYPYLAQYDNKRIENPEAWQRLWLFIHTRPLETLVIVPGNKTPSELVQPPYPFPYPVWVENLSIQDQTPFDIKVDRMGDWDADLVWEGTHAEASNYSNNRYQRTAFTDPGKGNYLKMTVAQGSPYTWCETNNNRYVIFYNLIRTNEKNHIADTGGTRPTNASIVGDVRDVPGVEGVQYVLLYGNQTNPNQFYHEVEPFQWVNDYNNPNSTAGKPGGWNPPGHQSNHTYLAIYFKKDAVVPISLPTNGGTDLQGNPYFYLEFKNLNNKKNWFVVGAIPVMHYYHSGVAEDEKTERDSAAQKWADELGKYAFNFLTDTKISFDVKNMYQVTTKYTTVLQNPYVAAEGDAAKTMTADSQNTVIALLPHHYQPIALGPDWAQMDTSGSMPKPVIWKPLRTSGSDFPVDSSILPNANKTDPNSPGYWGYWSPRGNQKAIVAGEFETVNLFQNFLPVTPPPQWDKVYPQTGIQAVRITDAGTGYQRLPTEPEDPNNVVLPSAQIKDRTKQGTGAGLTVLLEPNTDRIQQIDVVNGGSGYPNGNPPNEVTVDIDAPGISEGNGGRRATARAQVSGGNVVAVFMIDKGAGYRSSIQVMPASGTEPDPAIIPLFNLHGGPENLETGIVKVITGGAGWFGTESPVEPTVNVLGTGSGAKAEIVKPGEVIEVVDSAIGGFTSPGRYPWTGSSDDVAKSIVVYLPPPANGQPAQTAHVASVKTDTPPSYFKTLITDPGDGYTSTPTTAVPLDGSKSISLQNVSLVDGHVYVADPVDSSLPAPFSQPINVTFKPASGTVAREAQATFYPGCSVQSIVLDGDPISGYEDDLEIAFSGGDAGEMPEFDITIEIGVLTNVVLKNGGNGFYRNDPPEVFELVGGKGFNAALSPVMSRRTDNNNLDLIAVKVVRPGSNYPENVCAYALAGSKKLELDVVIRDGYVANVTLRKDTDYTNLTTNPPIFLTGSPFDPSKDYITNPAKGSNAQISFTVQKVGVPGPITNVQIQNGGERYLVNELFTATKDSLPAIPRFTGLCQLAAADQAYGFLAKVAKPAVKVEQVLYDSLISQFSIMGSQLAKPFGGAFGGKDAPDGYGLGNTLSSATKVLGVLYNLQQHYAENKQDIPLVFPSLFVLNQATGIPYEWPIYIRNHPLVTLAGGLQTMTQALQRTIGLFFADAPYTNEPDPGTWNMAYFSFYDKAGRVVVNPTATIPVYGVVSSVMDPPDIPDNQDKQGLAQWTRGKLWSGFGVSDQWNDQHYFYGYYLSAAGLLAVLDGSWDPVHPPTKLWCDSDRMGTAVDQWMKTLAYDSALEGEYYDYKGNCSAAKITYEKYSFFDQWNGHSWATGVSPGRAGDVEEGWTKWTQYGTGNAPYDDENENSTWEGIQAFSAIILWGAGTGRKPIVDQGIYLLTTSNAASDLYFLDKNYNLKKGTQNSYSWCPVTTGSPASGIDGGNSYDVNTGYVDANPRAFFGDASAGCSIVQKGSSSVDNFFYAYPTGSKVIEAYPPTPWTMGMSRNIGYMQKWAEAMKSDDWKQARESALFDAGLWLEMAMTSALCGVPYNPGDVGKVDPYVGRLWSSWIVDGSAPGGQATIQTAEKATSVLNFLHTLDVYGPPDWSIYAKAVDAKGEEVDDQIVFTAAFSKIVVDADSKPQQVITTFVAFNPTWQTCYVHFFRIGSDGTLSDVPIRLQSDENGWTTPIQVDPKKMTVLTYSPELFIANTENELVAMSVKSLPGGTSISKNIGPQSFVQVNEPQVGPLPWSVERSGASAPGQINSLPAMVALTPSLTAILYPPNPELFIANVGLDSIEKNVNSSSGGQGISVKIGPGSFVQVNGPQVGPLPWTVGAANVPNPEQVNSLPAIVNYGRSLTAVLYPSSN